MYMFDLYGTGMVDVYIIRESPENGFETFAGFTGNDAGAP